MDAVLYPSSLSTHIWTSCCIRSIRIAGRLVSLGGMLYRHYWAYLLSVSSRLFLPSLQTLMNPRYCHFTFLHSAFLWGALILSIYSLINNGFNQEYVTLIYYFIIYWLSATYVIYSHAIKIALWSTINVMPLYILCDHSFSNTISVLDVNLQRESSKSSSSTHLWAVSKGQIIISNYF